MAVHFKLERLVKYSLHQSIHLGMETYPPQRNEKKPDDKQSGEEYSSNTQVQCKFTWCGAALTSFQEENNWWTLSLLTLCYSKCVLHSHLSRLQRASNHSFLARLGEPDRSMKGINRAFSIRTTIERNQHLCYDEEVETLRL